MIVSQFHIYGMGFSAENLESGKKVLEVFLAEKFPMISGEIKVDNVDLEATGLDGDGKAYSEKITIGKTVPATWLGNGNIITPENVRRGERVILYKLGNSPKLYWRSAGMDQKLRRLETVIIAFNASPDVTRDINEFKPEDHYFFEISTHAGRITLSTSMANEEQASFTFQIDGKNGLFIFQDDKEANFTFNSVDKTTNYSNGEGLVIETDKKNFKATVPETASFICDKFEIEAASAIDFKTKAISFKTDTFKTEASKSFVVEAGESMTVNTNILQMEGKTSALIKAPNITLDGLVTATKLVTMPAFGLASGAGGMSPDGAMQSGPITANGAITTTGDLTVVNISATGILEAVMVKGGAVFSANKAVLTAG